MEEEEEQAAGAPAWVMTFADLMSLLMCFFVLLLAFSEMDAQKFKQLSGSMKEAFGVQADMKADFIPKGTSVVTQEFSPGRPMPTPIKEIRQFTIDSTKSTLKFAGSQDEGDKQDAPLRLPQEEEIERDVEALRALLREEIEQGRASVTREGARIVVQIHEHGSFPSGDADLRTEFVPTIDKLATIIGEMPGVVQITGHTDDVPISTPRFRSNWELSAARAVSVAHRLLQNARVDPQRFVVTGLADTQPQVPNDTPENRARNRRVQISIVRAIEPPVEMPASDDAGTPAPGDAAPAAGAPVTPTATRASS